MVCWGTQTCGSNIEGTDESTELWRHPEAILKSADFHNLIKIIASTQCDQIGQFFKVLGNKLSLSSSPNICQLFGLLLRQP